MIREILQVNNQGLGNVRVEECPGFEYMDSILPCRPEFHETYRPLAQKIFSEFPEAQSILELGCGAGNLAFYYRILNPKATYITLDISADVVNKGLIKKDHHFTVYTDRPFQLTEDNKNMTFDLILSYEHFEHIPENRIGVFLENIKKHCSSHTRIVATSALGGRDVHPITWDKTKWKEVLDQNGFVLLDKQVLTPEIVPFNFRFSGSIELIFKLK